MFPASWRRHLRLVPRGFERILSPVNMARPSLKLHLPYRATVRLHFLCAFFTLASFLWGYNIGILGTIYAHPGFKKALHHPDPSHTGLITAIYYLGTWISYIFLSHPAADYFGRRYAAATGVFVTCIGAALQASAGGTAAYTMMIIGRIICGLGIAIVSTSVPLYQSEISPAHERGKYVVMNHIGLVGGLAGSFWVAYGIARWDTERGEYLGWRLSVAVQFIPSIIFMIGVPFCPETPRWLVQKGKVEQARKSLQYLRDADPSEPEVIVELGKIQVSVEGHRLATQQSWKVLFTNASLFKRLWRVALLHFMAQMCGNTSMKYYLVPIFMELGVSRRISLMIGGIESTLKIGCTIMEMFLIDRLGRRVTLIVGCLVMGTALAINGALPLAYPNNANHVADYVCVVFIFLFTFGYSIGFGPAAWVYGSEIFPTNFRARGLNLAASGGSIGSIIASQTWPVGMANIGSKTYFIFMSVNLVSGLIIWVFYPETKNRSLEDMDVLFSGRHARGLSFGQETADSGRTSSDNGEEGSLPKTSARARAIVAAV
ncbi:general substrate transporter [Bisporella sp. PMI_857]|nr:general substrate transporter [Bisporella sp. PMI_857]